MSNITAEQQRQLKELPLRHRKEHAAAMRHANHLASYRPRDQKRMNNFLETCGVAVEKSAAKTE